MGFDAAAGAGEAAEGGKAAGEGAAASGAADAGAAGAADAGAAGATAEGGGMAAAGSAGAGSAGGAAAGGLSSEAAAGGAAAAAGAAEGAGSGTATAAGAPALIGATETGAGTAGDVGVVGADVGGAGGSSGAGLSADTALPDPITGASAASTNPTDFSGSMDLGQTGTGQGTFDQVATGQPGNVDIPSGTPGNPAAPATQTIGDKLLSSITNNPLTAAALGTNIASGIAQRNSAKTLANQEKSIAAPVSNVESSLLAQYQAGQINPSTQFQIDQWQKEQRAAVSSQYASAGQSGSTAERNALAQIDSQAASMHDQALQGLLTSGLSAAGVAQGPLTAAAEAQSAQDKEFATSQSSALNSLMLLQAINSRQGGSSTPAGG